MDDENNGPEPKIGIPLLIAGFLWYGLCDLIDIIPGAGYFTDPLDAISDFFVVHA
jgi:hypothetical protein